MAENDIGHNDELDEKCHIALEKVCNTRAHERWHIINIECDWRQHEKDNWLNVNISTKIKQRF